MRQQVFHMLNNMYYQGAAMSMMVKRYQKYDMNMNIALAIASSTSIAGWLIWDYVPYLWAGILAVAQVLTVLKPHLSYSKYVKELNGKCLQLDLINVEVSRLWQKAQKMEIDEDEIATSYDELEKRSVEIFTFSEDVRYVIPNSIKDRAHEQTAQHIWNKYRIKTPQAKLLRAD